MAAAATAALDSILSLRDQLFAEIDNTQEDPTQADRLVALEKQLRGLDMAIGQVRIYLPGFHRTLTNAQALTFGNIDDPRHTPIMEPS